MSNLSKRFVSSWVQSCRRFMPFADAASPGLPLSRLLRLSLFQVSVGMALALLVGALNRVLIVELQVPAALVAIMIALPVLYAPLRALIGFRSDNHQSAIGWRRVPFIWFGSMLQFGGFAVMPFALLVLSGGGEAGQWPTWVGQAGAALCFLLVGAGIHTTQTAGLALATDLAPPESHPKVVGLMYVSLLLGTIVSALAFGAALADFSPGRLVQVIQTCAVLTLVLNAVAMWKQESLIVGRGKPAPRPDPSFADAWATYTRGSGARHRLLAIGLGTMAFAMQDVLLEPFGGQVLGMGVGATTWLTAALATGGLAGFTLASWVLGRGADPARMSMWGATVGVPAFLLVIVSALPGAPSPLWLTVFVAGVVLIGFGGGLFAHGTLTLTMRNAPKAQAGLALGAWGAVQATAAGVAIALGGVIRDLVNAQATQGAWGEALSGPATGYVAVYALEVLLLLAALVTMRGLRSSPVDQPSDSTVELKLGTG